uniref:Synaptopodin n=1 Tax=Xiphophorus maculatus TaxID=8083 RepID=A0A3B5QWW6_XIPMA
PSFSSLPCPLSLCFPACLCPAGLQRKRNPILCLAPEKKEKKSEVGVRGVKPSDAVIIVNSCGMQLSLVVFYHEWGLNVYVIFPVFCVSLDLSRSASLSEKELKEARLKSHIIAAQLTIPSNSGSSSRGVQLFNRRKQRVNAFTLESCGQGSEVDKTENVKSDSLSNKQTWAERSCEDKDTDLNLNNNKLHFLPPASNPSTGGIMDEENKNFIKDEDTENYDIQERHFLPVKEEPEEEDDIKDKIHEVLEDDARHQTPLGSNDSHPAVMAHVERKTETNEGHPAVVPSEKLLNGCHSTSGSERISLVSPSKQTPAFLNRTARPFFSPPTVLSPDSVSPATDIPPPPSYATPPLPSSTQPVTFSPPPPPPSYPTPPLPAFTNQPPQTFYSGPLPMSPPMSSPCLSPSNFPVSQHPPAPHCGPLTAPKPSIFVPQSTGERKLITPIKTGILEEGAARRANKKSMFTFKEKPVVAPNPELLSLVQGADERKKHGHRSVPEPAPEEELLALGAEASNFLAKAEEKTTGARAPEWASCLKSSKTRPRLDHRPEQSLTNVSGKGAELFAKRQSRMEKYVVENQNPGQIRSPSPTMSLPPSWVYPSNMPGRVKAIPVPEPPTTLENGCSKIEMDLARHRPYQLNSSLFVFNPVKDPISTLPRGAPQAKNLLSSQSFSRHTSLPNTSPSYYGSMSPQLPLTSPRGSEYPANPASPHARITSLMSPFSPERVSSPRSGVQAPNQSSTTTSIPFSKPSENAKTHYPISPPWGSRCQPLQIFTATSPVCPPWSPRSQSPALFQSSSSFQSTNPLHTTATASSPRQQKDNRCTSQIVNNLDSKANHRLLAKNIINAAKRKNSPSPGALSSHGLPISPVGNFQNDWQKPPISPFQQRSLGAQSPTFTSPPVTPTQRICSPVRLYNTRSLTDSDASVESEDSGLRSPGLHSYNTCPRGWGGSLRVKRSTVSTDL